MESLLKLYDKIYRKSSEYNYEWEYYLFDDKSVFNQSFPEMFSTDTRELIMKIFTRGSKKDLSEDFISLSDKRCQHVVSAFFMGHYIVRKISFFSELLENNLISYDKERFFSWLWYLCCLYHDAYFDKEVLDKDANDNTTIDYTFAKESEGLLYDEDTIRKYEKYRKTRKRNDHGIYAASILSQKFLKRENTPINDLSVPIVTDENKKWVCKIAKVIACHNIFICLSSNDKKKYQDAELNNLIPSEYDNCKMPRSNSIFEKLYLLLCICDILEPVKRGLFLQDIKMSSKDNQITIVMYMSKSNAKLSDYNNYFKNIIDAECWLNYIRVSYNKTKERIRVNITIGQE